MSEIELYSPGPLQDFSEIRHRAHFRVQSVPDFIVDIAINDVLTDFCRESLFWQQDFEVIANPFYETYKIPVRLNTFFVELVSAYYKGSPGEYLSIADAIWMSGPETIKVAEHMFRKGTNLIVRAALAPTQKATQIPQEVVSYCADWIADGVAAKLMMQPNQPWSNYEMGMRLEGIYKRNRRKAKRAKLDGRLPPHNPSVTNEYF